jgi:hypothetical protein
MNGDIRKFGSRKKGIKNIQIFFSATFLLLFSTGFNRLKQFKRQG